jgi:uncharacterized phage-associated protein
MKLPNKALQPPIQPLRGFSAAELYSSRHQEAPWKKSTSEKN